jgi:geranylgeranyl reductase family protein
VIGSYDSLLPPPYEADVLVVGAGPAGCACAIEAARAGLSVILADQHSFPRDKICGDGLIPDAHAAFGRLGVAAKVAARAQAARAVGCVGPRGRRVEVPGRVAVLPRLILDEILRQAAVDAGATWLPTARMEGLVDDRYGGRVGGVTFRIGTKGNQQRRDIAARWIVLATGAVPQALMAAGMCTRRSPSGVALRGYVKNPAMAEAMTTLDVVWHRELGRGYGWIFPCGRGVFNVGVGLSNSHRPDEDGRDSMADDVNLRAVLDTFCRVHSPARQLVEGGAWLSAPKGAPLRCSLEGAKLTRPGLLVTGEAAGSTYAFTGEGIGKAMQTGMHAADAILELSGLAELPLDARVALDTDAQVRARYEMSVAALRPRFQLYERANDVNDRPWMIDLLLWRAAKSPRILKRMSAVLEEKGNPGNLVSMRGMLKLFVPIR